MIDIRSIRVRDTPVGALVDCRRNDRGSRDSVPLLGTTPAVTVFSSVLRELFPHTPASSWLRPRDPRASSRNRWFGGSLRTAEQARASFRSDLRVASMNEITCSFQANKSQRWMPWRQEPMKDVSDCEKLRGAVY
jgi:hypothetical protein